MTWSARRDAPVFPVFAAPPPRDEGDPLSVSFDADAGEQALRSFPGSTDDETLAACDAETRIARIEKEAYEKAFRLGEQAGRELGENAVAPCVEKLNAAMREVSGLRRTLLLEAERETVELAMRIARGIVSSEVERHADIVLETVRKALGIMSEKGTITLRVHPVDADAVWKAREALAGHLESGAEIQVVADDRVGRGGCLAVTDYTEVDATIESQLAVIGDRLKDIREGRR